MPSPNVRILHQADVEAVINREIAEANVVRKGTATIVNPVAPGAAYAQAEAAAVRDALVAVLDVLRAQGVIAP